MAGQTDDLGYYTQMEEEARQLAEKLNLSPVGQSGNPYFTEQRLLRLRRLNINWMCYRELTAKQRLSKMSTVDLSAAVLALAGEVKTVAGEMGVLFGWQIDLGIVTRCNWDEIRIMLLNLISNSLRYNRLNNPVHLSMRMYEQVVIVLKDQGIGMREDTRLRYGEPFYTWTEDAVPCSGAGLGAAVADLCARAHGGNLLVRSEMENGTDIEIRLPVRGGGKPVSACVDAHQVKIMLSDSEARTHDDSMIPLKTERDSLVKENFSVKKIKPVELAGQDAVAYVMQHGTRLLLNDTIEGREQIYLITLKQAVQELLERGRRVFVVEPLTRADLSFVQLLLENADKAEGIKWYAFFRYQADEREFLESADPLICDIRATVSGTGYLYADSVTPQYHGSIIRRDPKASRRHLNWLVSNCVELIGCTNLSEYSLPNRICALQRIPYRNIFEDMRESFYEQKPAYDFPYNQSKIKNALYASGQSIARSLSFRDLSRRRAQQEAVWRGANGPDELRAAYGQLRLLDAKARDFLLKYGFVAGIRTCFPELQAYQLFREHLRRDYPVEQARTAAFYISPSCRVKFSSGRNAGYVQALRGAVQECLREGKRVFVSDVGSPAQNILVNLLKQFRSDYPDIQLFAYHTGDEAPRQDGLLCGAKRFAAPEKQSASQSDRERPYLESLIEHCSWLILCCQGRGYHTYIDNWAMENGLAIRNIYPEVSAGRPLYSKTQALAQWEQCQASLSEQAPCQPAMNALLQLPMDREMVQLEAYRQARDSLERYAQWFGFLFGASVGHPELDMERYTDCMADPKSIDLQEVIRRCAHSGVGITVAFLKELGVQEGYWYDDLVRQIDQCRENADTNLEKTRHSFIRPFLSQGWSENRALMKAVVGECDALPDTDTVIHKIAEVLSPERILPYYTTTQEIRTLIQQMGFDVLPDDDQELVMEWICLCVRRPGSLRIPSIFLYKDLADRKETASDAVKNKLRSFIRAVWKKAPERLNPCIGHGGWENGPPSNKSFLNAVMRQLFNRAAVRSRSNQ